MIRGGNRLHPDERGAAVTYSGAYTGTDPLVCSRAALVHRLADESST